MKERKLMVQIIAGDAFTWCLALWDSIHQNPGHINRNSIGASCSPGHIIWWLISREVLAHRHPSRGNSPCHYQLLIYQAAGNSLMGFCFLEFTLTRIHSCQQPSQKLWAGPCCATHTHHRRTTAVKHTSPALCLQTAPPPQKSPSHSRNRDFSYQPLRQSLHEGFHIVQEHLGLHISLFCWDRCDWCRTPRKKYEHQQTLHCTSKSYIFCHGLFRIQKNLLFGTN